MRFNYDVIVIGAGHAGCEAAAAAARLGRDTLLITIDMNKIAQMSCNPAVGGIAKGQIVREIDALGGRMGIVTDRSSIQFRMLNRSKGPAMWSPRAQADRQKFIAHWREQLDATPHLYIWQDSVTGLTIEQGRVAGVKTALGVQFAAPRVILTAGTFLNGLMHIGRTQIPGGRISEPPATGITEQLRELGLRTDRMKTGTPVRIDRKSIDFSLAERQDGDADGRHFSYLPSERSNLKQQPCWIVYTNEEVHDILRQALPESPLYNGQIQSIGPRYCPSIETKIVTFADKTEHQLFIEPEGETTDEMYLNGFSSSLPWKVQIEALQKIPAFANLHIYRPGYAIEYDFFDPTQLYHTLESKVVSGLYLAGQVNGTTGYEEAAGQGLVAGINAAIGSYGDDGFTLARDEAYIGVLIDDLVNKGVDEPYRMFTSRAEYRILLRQDNADLRLTPRGAEVGLVEPTRRELFENKRAAIDELVEFSKQLAIHPKEVNERLAALGVSPLTAGCRLRDLVVRPQLSIAALAGAVPQLAEHLEALPAALRDEIVEEAEIQMKYAGYIERERALADKMQRLDAITLGDKIDYLAATALSTEARQKLDAIRPATIGQASRIPGVSPSDINILLLLLGK